jgi:hypothetical protein
MAEFLKRNLMYVLPKHGQGMPPTIITLMIITVIVIAVSVIFLLSGASESKNQTSKTVEVTNESSIVAARTVDLVIAEESCNVKCSVAKADAKTYNRTFYCDGPVSRLDYCDVYKIGTDEMTCDMIFSEQDVEQCRLKYNVSAEPPYEMSNLICGFGEIPSCT